MEFWSWFERWFLSFVEMFAKKLEIFGGNEEYIERILIILVNSYNAF